MNAEKLYDVLSKKFEIVCFENLSQFTSSHSALFHFFKKVFQSEYKNNQRLIFFSHSSLEQSFINHFQRAIHANNISNYFVLICSPYDITKELQLASQTVANPEVAIQYLKVPLSGQQIVDIGGYARDFDMLCTLPFLALSMTNNLALPCCKFNAESMIDSQNKHSIIEIFNSRRMQEVRTKMIQGEELSECSVCWNSERNNTVSLRNYAAQKYKNKLDFGLIDSPQLYELQIAPSIVCNFNCRICNAMTSSKIADEELRHAVDPIEITAIKENIKLSTEQSDYHTALLLNNADETFRNISTLRLVGGEPFLWKNLEQLLQTLVNLNYSDKIKLEFNTNGSVYPSTLIDTLKKFKAIEILVSIDTIGEKFEIQRGGNWADIEKNIKLFVETQDENFVIKMSPTVNIQNLLYLDELVNYFDQYSFEICWWYVENPDFLCIDNVTQKVKDIVEKKYTNHPVQELQSIAKRIKAIKPITDNRFIEYMNKLDVRRSQSFRKYHREIYEAMLIND